MTRWVVAFGFLVAFAAGYVVGLRPQKEAPAPTTRPSRRGGWLAAELKLTPEQQRQLDAIWSETASRGRQDREERRREIMRQRDEAIAALIPPGDQAKYEQVRKDFSSNMDALDQEWKRGFREAVEKTKSILTPEQKAKYERLLERHEPPDRGPRDHGRDDRRRDDR